MWVYIGIAVAACVLGVEVACIGILIRKLLHARKLRQMEDEQEAEHRYTDYAAVLLGAATVSVSAESVLSVLVILAAVAAAVFLILLAVFRARGYDYVSSELLRNLQAEHGDAQQTPVEEPLPAPETLPETVAEEDEFVPQEPSAKESEPESALEPEPEQAFGQAEEAPAADDEAEPQEPAAAAFAANEAPPAGGMAPIGTPPPFTGAGGPVRIVQYEKQVTETVKEVQNPAPSPAPSPAADAAPSAKEDSSADRLIEKLNTLIDKIDRRQEEAPGARPADSIAVSAASSVPGEEDEEDEDELEDAVEAQDEDDVDDEPDDPEHFTGNERIIGFDEETGCYIVAHYRKSFEAKLIQARPNIKHYYGELKNALLAYKGTKSRISWGADSFHNGRTAIAKINVKTRILELYLALDPASLEGTVYRGNDVGHLKKYADTPFRYKLRTPRKFKWAMELVERVCEEQGLSPIDAEKVDYETAYPFEDTDSLVSRGLIKEYIREEKPASTFELDETHVPTVPEVDDTVIPANANVSWELDNELLSQKPQEPAPAPEVEPEPEAEPEPAQDVPPVSEPAPAQTEASVSGTVIRETTKVTQMRYTEQYYGVPDTPPTYRPVDEPFISNAFFEAESVKPEPPKDANGDEAGARPNADGESQTQEASDPKSAPVSEHADGEADVIREAQDAYPEAEDTVETAESDELKESGEPEEPSERESDLLTAFDADAKQTDEDDLDWGIPASLTDLASQTPIDRRGVGDAQDNIRETGTDGSDGTAEFDVSDEPDDPEGETYGSSGGEVAEDADSDAELLYDGEENSGDGSEPDGQADVYDGADGYAESADGETEDSVYADSDEYAEDDSAYGASVEYAEDGSDDTDSDEYTEDGNAYADSDEYAEDGAAYDEAAEYAGEEASEYGADSAYAYDGDGEAYDESGEDGEYVDADGSETDAYADSYGEGYAEDAEYGGDPDVGAEQENAPKSQINPNVALVDVGTLETNFPYGAVINLDALKAKGLVLPTAKTLKIFAAGELSKAFTVVADQFSLDAIRAIDGAGGEIMMVTKK